MRKNQLWNLQAGIILAKDKTPYDSYYYTRKIAGYDAHVFLVYFQSKRELADHWNWIEEYIAFHYQSKVEVDIELSNFYICYFVMEEVDADLANLIEQGTYCAKKYVFSMEKKPSQTKACQMIEDKVFALKLENVIRKDQSKHKITDITINNFRKYAGERTFSLRDAKNDPASFVLVYAPNGRGKTSFTDSVEYALKGSVARLVELAHLTKAKGQIYHNINRPDAKGYVELKLTGDGIIHRVVGAVKNGKNDVWCAPIRKGKEITGLVDDSDKWNLMILPHDKVDNFLTATTPEERYEQWFNNAPDLKDERETFERLNLRCREYRSRLKNLDEGTKDERGISWLQKKVEDLEKKADSLENFLFQIQLYNEVAESEKQRIHVPDGVITLKEYSKMLEDILRIKTELETDLITGRDEKDHLEQILHRGIEQAKKGYDKYKKMQTAEELLLAVNRVQILEEEMADIEQKLVQLDIAFSLTEDVEEAENKENEIARELEELYSNREKHRNEEEQCSRDIDILKNELSTLENAVQTRQLPSILKSELEDVYTKMDHYQTRISVLNVKIHQMAERQKGEDERLFEARQEVNKYLMEHTEICTCPICSSEFPSWTALMEKVAKLNDVESEIYQEELNRYLSDKQMYLEDYQAAVDEFTERIQEIIQEKKRSLHFYREDAVRRDSLIRKNEERIEEKAKERTKLLTKRQLIMKYQNNLNEHRRMKEKVKWYVDHRFYTEAEIKELSEFWKQENENPFWIFYPDYAEKSEEELRERLSVLHQEEEKSGIRYTRLQACESNEGARSYVESYNNFKQLLEEKQREYTRIERRLQKAQDELKTSKENLEEALHRYFSQNTINKIYQKLDPHDVMKNMRYTIDFNEDKPQLYIHMLTKKNDDPTESGYQPELYFSTAQLNTVAFSSFFGRALEENNLPIRTIFIDDPIDNFDDMNMLGFADLIRSIIENTDCQIVMTTHDPKVRNIMKRKLDQQYHSSAFITL